MQVHSCRSHALCSREIRADPPRSSQVPLGVAACGILFLTYGAEQPATSAILLATILDQKWGLLLTIFYAFLLSRCITRKPLDG
jgi:hypothetical protein